MIFAPCPPEPVRNGDASSFIQHGAAQRAPGLPSVSEFIHVIKVQVRPNESLEAALRRFKRQCNFKGVFRIAKAQSWHEKRSDRRRRERRERLRTILKAARKNDPNFRGRGKQRPRPKAKPKRAKTGGRRH